MSDAESKELHELWLKVAELSGWMSEHNRGAEERSRAVVSSINTQNDTIKKFGEVIAIQTDEIGKINNRCMSNLPLIQDHIKKEEQGKVRKSNNKLTLIMAIGGWVLVIFQMFLNFIK